MNATHTSGPAGTFRRLLIFGALTVGLTALIASTVSATSAYFSDVDDSGIVRLTTGEVSIATSDTNLRFFDLMPGDEQSESFTVENTGDGNIDIYGWVEARDTGGDNPCDRDIEVRIPGWGEGWQDLCDIALDLDGDFSTFEDGSHAPVTLGLDVADQADVTVEVRMAASAGNDAAGLDTRGDTDPNNDDLIIYAVQAGGAAPDVDDFEGYDEADVFDQSGN